jgi:hypothetical protein
VVRKAKQPNASVPEAIGFPGLTIRREAARTSPSPGSYRAALRRLLHTGAERSGTRACGNACVQRFTLSRGCKQLSTMCGLRAAYRTNPPIVLFRGTEIAFRDDDRRCFQKSDFYSGSGIDCIVSACEGASRWPALFSAVRYCADYRSMASPDPEASSVLVPRTTSKLIWAIKPELL